jgi:hypothetical protein
MWGIDPLLEKDLEMNNETTVVVMKLRDKHASTTELLFGAFQLVAKVRL